MRDIFPEIQIPLEYIGWHIRQSTSIEAICTNFAAEILSSGNVADPTKTIAATTTTATTAAAAVTTHEQDDTLQTLYDVFSSLPRDRIQAVYSRMKTADNPNWYDDLVNELLSEKPGPSSTSKRSRDDEFVVTDDMDSNEYERLLAILPDIDPDFALERYLKFLEEAPSSAASNQTDFDQLVSHLIEHGYVKLTDKLERVRNERLKENLRNSPFDLEDFLKTFSDPLVSFYDQTKPRSESYKIHAHIYLANAFARVSSEHIRDVLTGTNHRFAPALKQLKEEFFSYHSSARKKSNNGIWADLSFRMCP